MFKVKFFAGGIFALLLGAGLTRLTYSMITGAPISVLDKGAKCDGTSFDDTAAIQRALDALPVGTVTSVAGGLEQIIVGGGGTVAFPQGGTCRLTSPGILVPANVTLDLNGSTLKVYGVGATGVSRKHNVGLYADNDVVIRNGFIVSGDAAATQNGVVLDTLDRALISNTWIIGFSQYGLWLKKSQYGSFTQVQLSGNGTAIRLDVNADNFGSHDNVFSKLYVAGNGTGLDWSGFNNVVLGGTIAGNTVNSIVLTPRGSEGTQNNSFHNVHFEADLTTFNVLNKSGVLNTVFYSPQMIVPPVPANKTKRFMRNEGGELTIHNGSTQRVNLAIGGSPAVVEHFSGVTRVFGGSYGADLTADQIVADETNSSVSTKIRDQVYVSMRNAANQEESVMGHVEYFRGATTDVMTTRNVGDTTPRLSIWSDGRIWAGPGTTGADATLQIRDGAGNVQWTIPGAKMVLGGTAALQTGSTTFAALPTPTNGMLLYCSDCTVASPCAAAGTGAFAKRINGAWVCN